MKTKNSFSFNIKNFFQKLESFFIDGSLLNFNLNDDIEIQNITSDSRAASKNSLFFLLNERNIGYLKNALESGAICIMKNSDNFQEEVHALKKQYRDKLFFIKNEHSIYKIYNLSVNDFFKLEEKFGGKLKIHAVTGTNGKSSVAFFFKQLMNLVGIPAASIGTIGICSDEQNHFEKISKITTPDAFELQKIILDLSEKKNIFHIAIEASSHGIAQHRIDGFSFRSVCFTNLSQDHLDYHKTMDEYWFVKKKLFEEIAVPKKTIVCINLDDPKSEELVNLCKKRELEFITYSMENQNANVFLTGVEVLEDLNLLVKISVYNDLLEFRINSIALFQVSNFMAAICMSLSNFEDKNCLKNMLSQKKNLIIAPPGRAEVIPLKKKNAMVIIDYAHTPDALKTILSDLKFLFKEKKDIKILTIFGCGGERDSSKRPLMGKIVSENSDFFIITSDNPRNEDIRKINEQILSGIDVQKYSNFEVIESRKKAFEKSITELSNEYQIILIAGKGHESEQIFANNRVENFNDKEVAKEIIEAFF